MSNLMKNRNVGQLQPVRKRFSILLIYLKTASEHTEPAASVPVPSTSPVPRRGSLSAEGPPGHRAASSPPSVSHDRYEGEEEKIPTTPPTPQKPTIRPQTLAKIQDSIGAGGTKRALHIVFDLDETLVYTSVSGKPLQHKVMR